MTKTPTLEEKVEMYEKFLHKINMYLICCNPTGVQELIANADNWSYEHRRGEYWTDEERQQMVDKKFWSLCNTPKADEETKIRQKTYGEYLKKRTEVQKLSAS